MNISIFFERDLDKLIAEINLFKNESDIWRTIEGINNSAGNVTLEIPKNTGMNLKFTGMKISIPKLENFSGTGSNEELKGTINGGGIPVTVDAGSGKRNVVFN